MFCLLLSIHFHVKWLLAKQPALTLKTHVNMAENGDVVFGFNLKHFLKLGSKCVYICSHMYYMAMLILICVGIIAITNNADKRIKTVSCQPSGIIVNIFFKLRDLSMSPG